MLRLSVRIVSVGWVLWCTLGRTRSCVLFFITCFPLYLWLPCLWLSGLSHMHSITLFQW